MAGPNFVYGTIGAPITLINFSNTSNLSSLAANTLAGPGTEVNNTIGNGLGWQQGTLTLNASVTNVTTTTALQVFAVPSGDLLGNNYPSFASPVSPSLSNYLIGTIYINPANQAINETFPNVTIPAGKFKVYVVSIPGSTTLGAGTTAANNFITFTPTPTQY